MVNKLTNLASGVVAIAMSAQPTAQESIATLARHVQDVVQKEGQGTTYSYHGKTYNAKVVTFEDRSYFVFQAGGVNYLVARSKNMDQTSDLIDRSSSGKYVDGIIDEVVRGDAVGKQKIGEVTESTSVLYRSLISLADAALVHKIPELTPPVKLRRRE